jgi:ABC-type glycerol-3-phosphate transport system permease component
MNRKPTTPVLVLQYIFLVVMTLFSLYPIWFVILASGRVGQRLYTLNLLGMFIPTSFNFDNFQVMLAGQPHPFLSWMRNSLFVAGFTTIACLLVATSAAFAFSRFKFYGRSAGLVLLLAIQAFPGVLSLVPVAQLLTALGLYANLWGLVMAYVVGNLVFTTWLLKGYFDTIPIEIEEAAMIDGCGPIQSFLLIGLPITSFHGWMGRVRVRICAHPCTQCQAHPDGRYVQHCKQPKRTMGVVCGRRSDDHHSSHARIPVFPALPDRRTHPGWRKRINERFHIWHPRHGRIAKQACARSPGGGVAYF